MKACCAFLVLILFCGCSSISARQKERSDAYAALPTAQRELVKSGRIERGMDTNAVYIAWGKPSAIDGTAPDETWYYYGNRPMPTPRWVFLPEPNGYGRMEYMPEPHSVNYVKAEVRFHNGRVLDWHKE